MCPFPPEKNGGRGQRAIILLPNWVKAIRKERRQNERFYTNLEDYWEIDTPMTVLHRKIGKDVHARMMALQSIEKCIDVSLMNKVQKDPIPKRWL